VLEQPSAFLLFVFRFGTKIVRLNPCIWYTSFEFWLLALSCSFFFFLSLSAPTNHNLQTTNKSQLTRQSFLHQKSVWRLFDFAVELRKSGHVRIYLQSVGG
jgi:hypothetical protein